MFLFYSNQIQEKIARFDPSESAHAIRSLRMKSGDDIHFTDGEGSQYKGKIEIADAKEMTASIETQINAEISPSPIHLAFVPTKSSDRFEFMVEKCVEIGVRTITPLLSKNVERKNVNIDRLHKIALSAMKQSQQLYLPKVNQLTKFTEFITQLEHRDSQKYIAYCGESNLPVPNKLEIDKKKPILILIGPEGDFSIDEYKKALSYDFQGISLGDSRLRTETAGIIAVHWFKTILL